ncbi:hypothetical protein JAAARDRAFT_138321 [Jaapia argillacea MUCL 33604]|uniref:Protein kinase domain-containing protein n=1 Tax=Jaapia argillacea MUCL 33604 TaxID=933084 RepID=A0A067PCJ5_9AGAM|nr:hypothetical protein JAAARDRAFT_138321 [Jaapia argillacea MUCL 33604]
MRRNNPLPLPPASHIPLVDKLTSTEQKIRKEIAIMKKLRHAHVVRLLEVIDDKQYGRIFMVMEYLGGGEVKWRNMDNEPILTVDQTRRIIRDVILGLEYLHYQGIIHRDIKPANLMYTSDRRSVKITDFGVSHFSYAQRLAAATTPYDASDDDPILMDESDLSKMAGTPPFMAPEVIWEMKDTSGGSVSGSASVTIDVWALGVTLFSLLFARVPFFDPDFNEWRLYRLICNEEWEVDETMGVDKVVTGGRRRGRGKGKEEEGEGAVVVGLLERLLEKDANKRIKLAQVKVRSLTFAFSWKRSLTVFCGWGRVTHGSSAIFQTLTHGFARLRLIKLGRLW